MTEYKETSCCWVDSVKSSKSAVRSRVDILYNSPRGAPRGFVVVCLQTPGGRSKFNNSARESQKPPESLLRKGITIDGDYEKQLNPQYSLGTNFEFRKKPLSKLPITIVLEGFYDCSMGLSGFETGPVDQITPNHVHLRPIQHVYQR